jgi:peroxiredoxin
MAFILPQHLPPSMGAPRVGQKAPDFTLADTESRSISLADLLSSPVNGKAPRAVLLIFQMGHGCHACSSELRDMQQHLDALYNAGIRPVAISNDTPDVSRTLARAAGYTFTFLADPQREAIRRFDLLDPDEDDAARPAEFLVDTHGIVRWRMLTSSIYVRARPAQILDVAKTLQ